MNRNKFASLITAVSAVGFIATAGLHSTGYDSIVALAGQAPPDLRSVLPALWLMFSFDLFILGLILSVTAIWPFGNARFIVAIAGLCPISAAVLQLIYVGFIPPAAILICLGVLCFVAAVLNPTPSLDHEGPAA